MARTVTVACKIPNGIILRIFRLVDFSVPFPGGGTRTEKRAEQIGEPIVIAGCATRHNEAPKSPMVAGHALTHNVDADLWDEWKRQNADSEIVRKNLVFAYEDPEEVAHEARELKSNWSGMGAMDMSMVQKGERKLARDPRVPRSSPMQGSMAVETAEKD